MSASVLEEIVAPAPAPPERFPHPDVVAWSSCDGDTASQLTGELPGLRRGLAVVICTYKRAESLVRCLESLAEQRPLPDALVVVDASPDAASEAALARVLATHALPPTTYFRVQGTLAGLTRQRNFALGVVEHDLVAFFDDDVVFEPGCLEALERVLRERPDAAGAGVAVVNESARPNALWRARRLLGIVPDLTPGRYTRSGMSIPWSFLGPRDGVVEGDFLPGCGMAFRTEPARRVRFHDAFAGYAQGEDLDFSLRMRRHGVLLLACEARLTHLVEPQGRPDARRLGTMAIRNRWEIQKRGLTGRTPADARRFVWAWGADTLLMARHLLFPSRVRRTLEEVSGRLAAVREIWKERGVAG